MTLTSPSPADVEADPYPSPGDVCMHALAGWKPHPHLCLINDLLTPALLLPNQFLVVEAPVRHGKSQLVTIGGAAYSLIRFPDEPVLLGCHTDALARKFGRTIRRVVRSLAPSTGVRVSSDSSSASEFELVGHPNGGFKGVGVGSTPTGSGGQRIFVDDPVKHLKQLRTIEQRDELWDWFTQTMRTRLHGGGSTIVVMSRWHEDDIVGRIFSPEYGTGDPWTRVTLPALAHKNDAMGRAPGEALCPEMGYDADTLDQTRITVGPRIWGANYDQHPQTPEGRLFDPAKWTFCDSVPAGSTIVRWWDNAATKGGSGAYSAGVLMALTPDRQQLIVIDVYRERVGSAERRAKQRALAIEDMARWGRVAASGRVTSGAEQEPASGGKDQAELFVTDVMAGLPATTETTSEGSKVIRAETFAAQQGAGRVALLTEVDPRTGRSVPPAWAAAYLAEHKDFPLGATKDMVDASAHAANWLLLRGPRGTTGSSIQGAGGRRLKTGGVRV